MAGPIIAACATPGVTDHRGDGTTRVKHELFLSQVEVAIGPHVSLGDLRAELAAARASLADGRGGAAASTPVAVPGPVLAMDVERSGGLSPGERYARIEHHFAQVARQSLMCALHVHVEVADERRGRGRDRPRASLDPGTRRDQRQLAVLARPRRRLRQLALAGVEHVAHRGAGRAVRGRRDLPHGRARHGRAGEPRSTRAMVNLDVRLSHRYPTVEFRVADVCTDVDGRPPGGGTGPGAGHARC